MSASRDCVYGTCKNSRASNKNLTFFHFPTKDDIRCKEWLRSCGKKRIVSLEPNESKSLLICEKHFVPEFLLQSSRRKILSRSAVPIRYEEVFAQPDVVSDMSSEHSSSEESIELLQPKETMISYPGPSKEHADSDSNEFLISIDNQPMDITKSKKVDISSGSSSGSRKTSFLKNITIPSPDTPRKIKLKKKICSLKYTVKRTSDINSRLRRQALSFSTKNVPNSLLKDKSPSAKTLVYMQCFHKKRTIWTNAEKQLALSLYYKSPSNYKFMLKTLGFVIPGISTIQSWLKVYNLKTGLNTKLIEKFKLKISSMESDEKQCVLMFDEMALKKGLDHNKFHDVIEGYEDFGNEGRYAKLAKTALVFYVRGLLYNWKMPVCYYLSSGPVKGNIVSKLLIEVIQKLEEIGLNVRITVCDQGANNRSALSLLGATKEVPKITVRGKDIFVCYDVPHLLKSLRNNFMNQKLNIFVDGKLVSWNDFVEAYKIDKSSQITRSMLKITDKHIYPTNFQKMRVKFAAQVFSHSVSSTIYTLMATGQLQTVTAANSAAFMKRINDIFDCLNSRVVKNSNPFKSSLSVFRSLPCDTLTEALKYFENIKIFENSSERHNIHCIDGFIWTIKAILMLWKELQNEGKKYLLTSRISQDPLENLFSVLRNRGGYNPQPTTREFRIALQCNMHIRLMPAVESSNCEEDGGDMLNIEGNQEYKYPQEDEEQVVLGPAVDNENIESDHEEDEESVTCLEQSSAIITLQDCVNVYVAGYLCFKLFKKFDCNRCKQEFLNESEIIEARELHLFYKNYGINKTNISYLTRTKKDFSDLVTGMLQKFNFFFQTSRLHYGIEGEIKANMVSYVQNTYPNWFEVCRNHKMFILEHLVKIKLYRILKWEVESEIMNKGNESYKPHRKIRILSSD